MITKGINKNDYGIIIEAGSHNRQAIMALDRLIGRIGAKKIRAELDQDCEECSELTKTALEVKKVSDMMEEASAKLEQFGIEG